MQLHERCAEILGERAQSGSSRFWALRTSLRSGEGLSRIKTAIQTVELLREVDKRFVQGGDGLFRRTILIKRPLKPSDDFRVYRAMVLGCGRGDLVTHSFRKANDVLLRVSRGRRSTFVFFHGAEDKARSHPTDGVCRTWHRGI